MQIDVTLPKLSDDVDDAEIIKLLVSEGDQVEADQIVAEVGSDKASADIQAPKPGRVSKIAVSQGETIAVGALILTVEVSEGSEAPADEPAAPAADDSGNNAPQQAPEQEQEQAQEQEADEPAAEATEAQPAPEPEPTQAAPEPAPAPKPAPKPAARPKPAAAPAASHTTNVPAGPAIRRLAREAGVDLTRVTGTGPGGRITREDVLEVVRRASEAQGGSGDAEQQRDAYGPIHVEPLSKIRRTIAEQMHRSWSTVPRVTNFDDADVTELERMRQSSKKDYQEKGIKLTTMPFLIKAVAMSLREHPQINAAIDMDQGQIIYKQYVHVGIAVDTDNGLVVPVLRDADDKSISEIARELSDIAQRVRDRKFSLDDIKGSSFTISNLGAIGGTYSTPIVNVPEVAILLVGRARKMPVVVEDNQVAIRLMMPLSLSYDHRLVDGGAAARFLNEVIDYLEAPSRLLLAP